MIAAGSPPGSDAGSHHSVLVTNDDGYDSKLLQRLTQKLLQGGYNVIVVAPESNQSACAQKLTMGSPLKIVKRDDILQGKSRAFVYTVSGTPSDCVIAALEPQSGILNQLGITISMVISGINAGPNLGSDIMYSGTFAAARQAGVYGFPSLASSLATYEEFSDEDMDRAVDATLQVAQVVLQKLPPVLPNRFRDATDPLTHHDPEYEPTSTGEAHELLRDAVAHGDIVLNLNVAKNWNGDFSTCRLGAVFYRDVLRTAGDLPKEPGDCEAEVRIGGGIIVQVRDVPLSDIDTVDAGGASISTLNCWPESHPLQVSPLVMSHALVGDSQGIPAYLRTTDGSS